MFVAEDWKNKWFDEADPSCLRVPLRITNKRPARKVATKLAKNKRD